MEEIISTNGLSQKDRLSLQKELNNISKKKTAEATGELGRFGAKIYKDANTYFGAQIPAHMKDEALRTFFYRTTGKKMGAKESTIIMQNVAIEMVHGKRQNVQDAFDFARKQEGGAADLRLEKSKQGVFAVNLYKDGKRVKIVRIVGKEDKE